MFFCTLIISLSKNAISLTNRFAAKKLRIHKTLCGCAAILSVFCAVSARLRQPGVSKAFHSDLIE
jgi:hypothetical protein